ncbi:MAG: CHAD domain-containing protein [Candidatus Binatia bacterium]
MEQENESPLESAETNTQAPQTTVALDARRSLTRLVRKRLKKFVALAPQVRAGGKPKIIHDARVWSRRLQQAIDALFPKPRSAKVRRLRRTPRRIRRALGEWRNCDVLLEIVARQHRRTRSEAKRQAWAIVRDYLLQKRAKEVARAEKRLVREDVGDYGARAEKALRQASAESPDVLMQRLDASVQAAWIAWQSALARAQETRAVVDLHAFRIATKVLRYRSELLFEIGAKPLKAELKSLADLQDAIGIWHDRQVFHQAVAEALARAEVLLNEMPAVRILLAELEKERSGQANEVEKIFRLAMEHAGNYQMASASEIHATPTLSGVTELVIDKT